MISQNTNNLYRHDYFLMEVPPGLEGSPIYQRSDSFILEVFQKTEVITQRFLETIFQTTY